MKNIIAIVILFLSLSAKAQREMQVYLTETQAMVKQGKYKEALDRFVWFHEHALEHEPAMSGVRLSFALSYWKSLGTVYPPAQTALIDVRDRKTKQLVDTRDGSLFAEVAALNKTLEDNSKTLDLFIMLDKSYPDIAIKSWRWARDILFKAERYDILSKYITNPMKEFAQMQMMHNTMAGDMMRNSPNQAMAMLTKSYDEKKFADGSLQLIQLALFNNDLKSAKEIQQKAMAIVTDYRLNNAIPAEKRN